MQEKVLCNSDKEFRHQSAVRQLCKWRHEWGLNKFRIYLHKYNWSQEIIDDFYEQFRLGNKGEKGCWKKQSSQQQDLGI